MAGYPTLVLKADRDIHVRHKHHAIFQDAVESFPDAPDGAIVEVRSAANEFLCYATLNRKAYICARAIAWEKSEPMGQLRSAIKRAVDLRRALFVDEDTNALRLINAEGDGIPGLIADRYADVLVLQLTTLGMEAMRPWLVKTLQECTGCAKVFEKSTSTAREKEGLTDVEGWVRGEGPTRIAVRERGIDFLIELAGSQKTGLFLDQREMRSLVRAHAKGRTVLDCCSYVGGFSVSALKGGALAADPVDYDAAALDRAREHATLNGFTAEQMNPAVQDAFEFLRRKPLPRAYDFIVLDPPAFAKRSDDIEQASRAYIDLNRMALEHLPAGGLLLTCSCSYHIDVPKFQSIVVHAARQARRSVRIVQRHRQALDHPVNLFHPETDYLKSLLLWVD